MSLNWKINSTNSFKHQYKGKSDIIKDRTNETLKQLMSSEDPKSEGKKKKPFNFYAIELSSSDRLAFAVDEENRQILLMRVCTHNQVYR